MNLFMTFTIKEKETVDRKHAKKYEITPSTELYYVFR